MAWTVKNVTLRVGMHTEGPLAAFGHNRHFDQPATVSIEASGDLAGAKVKVEGDLRKTTLPGSDISEKDRREILARKDQDVFETRKYPTFEFDGVYDAMAKQLRGKLTLHGVTQHVTLPVALLTRPDGYEVEGSLSLDLRPFGIKPYKALLGAIRVNPSVEVSYTVDLARGKS